MTPLPEMFALARQQLQGGNLAQAEHLCQLILQADPNHADAHHLLGLMALQSGRFHVAVASIRRAVHLNPQQVYYRSNLGLAHQALGQMDEALAHFQEALRLKPDFAEGHRNVGKTLLTQGRVDEAVAHGREAVRIRPDFAEAHNSLAIALLRHGNPDEAVAHCQEALRLKPDYVEAQNNLGTARKQLGQFDEALASFEQALRLKREYGVAHWNRSMMRLLGGDFEQGWPEYEWRWALHAFAVRQFPKPLWDGSDLKGRTILLYAEQGLGDTLQFMRYLPLVKRQGARVIVECHPPLLRLLASVPGIDHLLGRGSQLPPFDVQAPLLSLPRIFHTTLETIPAPIPCLQADAGLVKHWKSPESGVRSPKSEERHLTSDFGLRTSDFLVGIAWQGSPEHPGDRQRSIPLLQFARLAQVEGVKLISLQKGPGTDQLKQLRIADYELRIESQETKPLLESAIRNPQSAILYLGDRLDEASGPFMDSAAVMMNLDLVISSDTVVPHLAGALGVPVWVAVPLAPDWRWLLEREDSPWYPSMRLFRQKRYGQWEDVFERLAEELRAVVSC